MRIHIEASESQVRRVLRRLASRHATQAVRHFRWMMPSVTLWLSTLAGAVGGLDKRCVVQLKTSKTEMVTMTSLAKEWSTAIEIALGQASRRVAELWRSAVLPKRSPKLAVPRRLSIR